MVMMCLGCNLKAKSNTYAKDAVRYESQNTYL